MPSKDPVKTQNDMNPSLDVSSLVRRQLADRDKRDVSESEGAEWVPGPPRRASSFSRKS